MAHTCFSCSSCGLSFSGLRMGAASLMMMMVMMTLLTSHVAGAVSESSADTLLADRAHPTENLLLWTVAEWKLFNSGDTPECDSACASAQIHGRPKIEGIGIGTEWGSGARHGSAGAVTPYPCPNDLCLLIPRARVK